MRPLWKDILTAFWLGMVLPGIMLNGLVWKERHPDDDRNPGQQAEAVCSVPSILLRDPDGTEMNLELDTYLTGVLLAEIPAQFHAEALKAQAVAARTYTWKAHTTGGKHEDGSLCAKAGCCQAYMDEESYLSQGGSALDLEKIRRAVRETSDFVLAYEDCLIEATYFSSSGGRTEAAVAVWGADYPYLQSVDSPEEPFLETVTYTAEDFRSALGKEIPGDPADWFGSVSYTEGGGVERLEICGETYTGVELRSLLGLRSTAFQIETEDQNICMTTKGYGHRVGMSQYGANAMAEAGSTWQQILQHYYPGAVLVPIS